MAKKWFENMPLLAIHLSNKNEVLPLAPCGRGGWGLGGNHDHAFSNSV